MPGPSHQIQNANLAGLTEAAADAREAKTEVELLRHDIDRLLLITETLWGFLKKEHGYSDEELVSAITALDLKDGVLDGKATRLPSVPCPACGRPNTAKRNVCIYCRNPLPMSPFAR